KSLCSKIGSKVCDLFTSHVAKAVYATSGASGFLYSIMGQLFVDTVANQLGACLSNCGPIAHTLRHLTGWLITSRVLAPPSMELFPLSTVRISPRKSELPPFPTPPPAML